MPGSQRAAGIGCNSGNDFLGNTGEERANPTTSARLRNLPFTKWIKLPATLSDCYLPFNTASVLVTMGCGEACPYVPGLQRLDWPLLDPKGQSLEPVRTIRDEIHEKVKALIRSECSECVTRDFK